MKSVPIEQLPQKQRKEVERFLKRNRDSLAAKIRPRFGLSGLNWVALDADGCMGIGSTPSIALRRFNHLCADDRSKPTINGGRLTGNLESNISTAQPIACRKS
jgi:hypothetical protein